MPAANERRARRDRSDRPGEARKPAAEMDGAGVQAIGMADFGRRRASEVEDREAE